MVSSLDAQEAAPGYALDGEPLCLPPEPADLCDAARQRWPEVEADLRRRLSGPDRSIEAVELESVTLGHRHSEPPRAEGRDPLLEQAVLALCAAHLLGRRALLPLGEALALRGVRVERTTLLPEQPPRALETLRHGPVGNGADIEVCRAARSGRAARTLLALAAAGLSRPVVIIDPLQKGAALGPATADPAPFHHAGLPEDLQALLLRAAVPYGARDAGAQMAPLYAALSGRNPWHLHRLGEVTWHTPSSWSGPRVPAPQLLPAGQQLAEQALQRPPSADEAFALACYALGTAERLLALTPDPAEGAEACLARLADPDTRLPLLLDALRRLLDRALAAGQDGEPPLFLKLALSRGLFLVETHHPEELGRLICPAAGGGYARLRLLAFPREAPRLLQASTRPPAPPAPPAQRSAHREAGELAQGPARAHGAWAGPGPVYVHVDGGDLRVHIELCPPRGLLREAAAPP